MIDVFNLKKELQRLQSQAKNNGASIMCADIQLSTYELDRFPEYQLLKFYLPVGCSLQQYDAFWDSIDIDYSGGVMGVVWFTDGSWASPIECDSEQIWHIHKIPPIPPHVEHNDASLMPTWEFDGWGWEIVKDN
jgi:hypothetical protein